LSRRRQRQVERFERRRVAFADANPRLLRVPRPPLSVRPRPAGLLRQVEDRRLYHPLGRSRPAAGFFLPRHRLVVPRTPARRAMRVTAPLLVGPGAETSSVPIGIGFQAPRQVAVCIRRKTRREVIHAKGIAVSRVRRPRRTEYSGVEC